MNIKIVLFAVQNGRFYAIGCLLWHRGGKVKLLRFPRNPVLYIYKSKEQMFMTTYSYAIQPIFGAIQNS